MLAVDVRADFALHGSQTELADLVVPQDELGISGAEHALRVKQDDRLIRSVDGKSAFARVVFFRRHTGD